MSLLSARNRLLTLWFIASTLLICVVTAQAIGGKYGTAWYDRLLGYTWLAPWLVPTLTMMITVSSIAIGPGQNNKQVHNLALFRVCWWASVVYFVSIAAIPLGEPFTDHQTKI